MSLAQKYRCHLAVSSGRLRGVSPVFVRPQLRQAGPRPLHPCLSIVPDKRFRMLMVMVNATPVPRGSKPWLAATPLVTNPSCPLRSETVVAPKSLDRYLRAPSEVRLPVRCLRRPDWFSRPQVALAYRRAPDWILRDTLDMLL